MSETELIERLEKLERDTRRLKRAGSAVLVALVALATTYATRSVANTVRTREIDVVDRAGNARITIDAKQGMPTILLSDAGGTPHMGMYVNRNGFPILWLTGRVARYKIPAPIRELATMQASIRVYVSPSSGEPTITLSDPRDFRMDLGDTETVTPSTGETHQTSAASIVMFGNGKKHHVIWQAP
jgi:hypothetical protein